LVVGELVVGELVVGELVVGELVVGELFVGEFVVGESVAGESPPVVTLGADEHAAPSKARATTPAARPARRYVLRGSGECDGFMVVEVKIVIRVGTHGNPVRFAKFEIVHPPPAPCPSARDTVEFPAASTGCHLDRPPRAIPDEEAR
jgi:hypothetical protein